MHFNAIQMEEKKNKEINEEHLGGGGLSWT